MAAAEVEERRLLDPAAIEGQRAARMEAAARRDEGGVGRLALQDRPCAARTLGDLRRLGRRQDADQRPGVRVARIVDDLAAGPISRILPRYMTAMRSAMTQASDRSWVMNR